MTALELAEMIDSATNDDPEEFYFNAKTCRLIAAALRLAESFEASELASETHDTGCENCARLGEAFAAYRAAKEPK